MRNWYKPKLSACMWILAVLWGGLLFFFSGQSGAESGALSLRFTRFVLRLLPFLPDETILEPILRKCAHFGIFAVEGALLGSAMMTCLRERGVGGLLAALFCGVLAALNEIHQSFSIGRSCEFRDVLIDSAGGVTGVLFAALALWLIFRFARRRAPREDNVII